MSYSTSLTILCMLFTFLLLFVFAFVNIHRGKIKRLEAEKASLEIQRLLTQMLY